MTNQEQVIFNQMMTKAARFSVEELKKVIREDSTSPVLPEVVFDALMNALQTKISENEFITFLDSVE